MWFPYHHQYQFTVVHIEWLNHNYKFGPLSCFWSLPCQDAEKWEKETKNKKWRYLCKLHIITCECSKNGCSHPLKRPDWMFGGKKWKQKRQLSPNRPGNIMKVKTWQNQQIFVFSAICYAQVFLAQNIPQMFSSSLSVITSLISVELSLSETVRFNVSAQW